MSRPRLLYGCCHRLNQADAAHARVDEMAAVNLKALETELDSIKRLASRVRSSDAMVRRLAEEGSDIELYTLGPVSLLYCGSI